MFLESDWVWDRGLLKFRFKLIMILKVIRGNMRVGVDVLECMRKDNEEFVGNICKNI